MNMLIFSLSNMVMQLFGLGPSYLLNDNEIPWPTEHLEFLNPLVRGLRQAVVPILIIAGTAGTIYAVILGVNMARAETAEKREEAKKRIINTIVAMAITVILISIFFWFINSADNWFGADGSLVGGGTGNGD